MESAISPIVHADRSVTFALHAPNADSVHVKPHPGEPLMATRDSTGTWHARSRPLEPGVHFYSFSLLGADEQTRFPSIYGLWIKPIYLIFSFTLGQAILPWDWMISIPAALLFGYLFICGFPEIIKDKEISLFFICFFIIPIILGLFITDLMPRYMIFIYPFYIAHNFVLFVFVGFNNCSFFYVLINKTNNTIIFYLNNFR